MKLEYILDMYGNKFDDRLKGLLDRAQNASLRLTHIVQGMYELAKLGSKALRMEQLSLKTLIEEVIQDLSFNESLDITIGIGDIPQVWGSSSLLRRVFGNLISNAVKYADKSSIVINIGARGFQERNLGTFVEIFVEDNGAGIPDEDQQTIFSIFSRGSQFNSKKEGLGLGLSVVQRIIEMHFGKVWVESEMGRGSTFVFTLPVDEISFVQ